jgi:hypothetical protein
MRYTLIMPSNNFLLHQVAICEWAFNYKNNDQLQIAYEWSTYEPIYVNHIHHPYEIC